MEPKFMYGELVQHVKSGYLYRILDTPETFNMRDGNGSWTPAYLYFSIEARISFAQPKDRMEDGRFVRFEE